MAVRTYTMTPQRRGWLLAHAARGAGETVAGQRIGGGEQVACHACGKAIYLMSRVVSVQNSNHTRQYHARCWRRTESAAEQPGPGAVKKKT